MIYLSGMMATFWLLYVINNLDTVSQVDKIDIVSAILFSLLSWISVILFILIYSNNFIDEYVTGRLKDPIDKFEGNK
jgi:hypothetical protein